MYDKYASDPHLIIASYSLWQKNVRLAYTSIQSIAPTIALAGLVYPQSPFFSSADDISRLILHQKCVQIQQLLYSSTYKYCSIAKIFFDNREPNIFMTNIL